MHQASESFIRKRVHERDSSGGHDGGPARPSKRANRALGKQDAHPAAQAPRVHECTTCGKAFPCPSKDTEHVRVHTGERPYVRHPCEAPPHAYGRQASPAISRGTSASIRATIHDGERRKIVLDPIPAEQASAEVHAGPRGNFVRGSRFFALRKTLCKMQRPAGAGDDGNPPDRTVISKDSLPFFLAFVAGWCGGPFPLHAWRPSSRRKRSAMASRGPNDPRMFGGTPASPAP